jgi:GNAT superfamily N-acetyltransferase
MPDRSGYEIRPGTPADLPVYQRILYEAVAWNPDRQLPPMERTLRHPELARYHEGWGRPGDIAVVATLDSEPVGGALCRLFTQDDHGEGFVDEETPEIAVAVWPEHRGRGLGGRLLAAIAGATRAVGIARLSLSVEQQNPAARLYLRSGYTIVSEDGDDYVMVAAT